MIVCPVCENQQAQGLECDVCGKDLSSLAGLGALEALPGLEDLGPPPMAGETVPGLEVTLMDRVGEVAIERDAALELAPEKIGEVPVEKIADLDGQPVPLGEVPVEPMLDLSVDRAEDDGVRTAAVSAGAITCRYCRNVQETGMICDRCGMKLPRASATQIAEIHAKVRPGDTIRCRYCGAPNPPEERCRECGRPLPTPDD